MALGDFYDAVASAADEFAECYMGTFGKLKPGDFPTVRLSTADPVTHITDLRTWITQHRDECCGPYEDESEEKAKGEYVDCTELANLIDNILAVVDKTLYKLKFLS